jgi:hypothetical protein
MVNIRLGIDARKNRIVHVARAVDVSGSTAVAIFILSSGAI